MKIFKKVTKEYVISNAIPFKCCHASTLEILADGTVLCAWFAGSKEGADDVNIWGSRRNNGEWEKPHIIVEKDDVPLWNPVLFTREDYVVILFYKMGKNISSWQTMWMFSGDGGCKWNDMGELVPGDRGGRGPVRNKIIRTFNGRWLAPASLENDRWRCFVDCSDDMGKTWQKSNEIFIDLIDEVNIDNNYTKIPVSEQSYKGRGVIQPTLWESSPNMVHMLMRSSEGHIYRSDSNDNGKSWCAAYATPLPNNNSAIDLAKTSDGKLYLVYNPVAINWGPRTPLYLACSENNGITWNDIFVFEDKEGEYSYPVIVYRNDTLFVSYTYDRKNIAFWELKL